MRNSGKSAFAGRKSFARNAIKSQQPGKNAFLTGKKGANEPRAGY